MKIAVIAANGRSGQVFVTKALELGHEVSAGIHSHNPFKPHSNLQIFKCDAFNKNDLFQLINNQDAVVSLIGHTKGAAADLQTKATQNIIEVMQATGVKRLVSLTGTGVRLPGDNISILDKILNFGVQFVDSQRILDGRRHFELLQNSQIDWSVIRVLKLQDTKPRPYALTSHGPAKLITSRQEVATAILEILQNESFIKQSPIISKS